MSARWTTPLLLLLLACGGGEQQSDSEDSDQLPEALNAYLGIWVQHVPSGDSLPNRLTCRVDETGNFRLVFQHGHMRPFADHRGRWTLLEDGRLGVRFHSAGTEPDTITVHSDDGRMIVPFPLRGMQELVFGVRQGAPPST